MNGSTKSILIVTQKFDPHADSVIRTLAKESIPFFRLNTDDFHADLKVTAETKSAQILLCDRWGRSHVFPHDTLAVWHRKPVDPAPALGLGVEAEKVALQETLEFLSYFRSVPGPRWINDPDANVRASRKFPQLLVARELGLRTPEMIITNDPERARAFQALHQGRLLCKSMKAQVFHGDEGDRFIFSRKVAADEFDAQLGVLKSCPTLLQEYVEKDHELRVTIFGERVFCCRIDSQSVAGAESDWRRMDPFKVPHSMVELSPDLERPLKAMMGRAGLSFAAFDLIIDPDGRPWFLEMNPNGQWLWMELMTGAPMTKALVELLMAADEQS